jgi:hypothetical protein
MSFLQMSNALSDCGLLITCILDEIVNSMAEKSLPLQKGWRRHCTIVNAHLLVSSVN